MSYIKKKKSVWGGSFPSLIFPNMGTVSVFCSPGNKFRFNNVEICNFILWKVKLKGAKRWNILCI